MSSRDVFLKPAGGENFVAEARLRHDVARLGDSASVARRLVELSEVVEGEMVGLFAHHANALARRSRTDLEVVAEQFEIRGRRSGTADRRETEVAELAAAGASSNDIAGRLFLSLRTVENHLQHAYTKLGVTVESSSSRRWHPRGG